MWKVTIKHPDMDEPKEYMALSFTLEESDFPIDYPGLHPVGTIVSLEKVNEDYMGKYNVKRVKQVTSKDL
jgi:hypothetical protein